MGNQTPKKNHPAESRHARKRRMRKLQRIRRVRRIRKALVSAGILVLVIALGKWLCDIYGVAVSKSEPGNTTLYSAERAIGNYAKKNGSTLEDYPEDLIELYEKNPEARDFVLEYPQKKDLQQEIDLGEYASSGEVPLLMQWDERWGYQEYAGTVLGISGCGPTCLSMVTIYLTGDTSKNPRWIAEFASERGLAVDGSGSKWTLMTEGGMELGMAVEEIPGDRERVENALAAGNPVVAIMGPGDFTTDGHFIVLTGMEDGKVKVNDPNSRKNSEKTWDLDRLLGQARNLWEFRRVE